MSKFLHDFIHRDIEYSTYVDDLNDFACDIRKEDGEVIEGHCGFANEEEAIAFAKEYIDDLLNIKSIYTN